MAKRRRTVDNEHLTLVVAKTLLGLRHNVRLVSNYGLGIEEIVMSSQRYSTQQGAVDAAKRLGKQLNVKVHIENV